MLMRLSFAFLRTNATTLHWRMWHQTDAVQLPAAITDIELNSGAIEASFAMLINTTLVVVVSLRQATAFKSFIQVYYRLLCYYAEKRFAWWKRSFLMHHIWADSKLHLHCRSFSFSWNFHKTRLSLFNRNTFLRKQKTLFEHTDLFFAIKKSTAKVVIDL